MSKSMSLLLRKASSMNTAKIEKQIDGKLNDQFRYFRREFMEAASVQGVTMPLELVEDKSGRFFTFVNANGPRYLLQIIHSQAEGSAIMRCAISLLIVTMALLRRKLPENRPKAAGTNWMSLLSGNINGWASQILSTISDGASVSICINLLAKSKILVIRELVLSLIALLVNTSEEAVIQMVTSPNHQQMSAKEMEERFRKENLNVHPQYKLTIDDKIKFNPTSPHGTCLAIMFATVADNRNHFSIVSACAEVVIAMTQHRSARIAQIIAGTSIQGPPPKEKKESEQKTLLKKVLNPQGSRDTPKTAAAVQRAVSADHKKRSPVKTDETTNEFGVLDEPMSEPVKLAEQATWDAIHILVQFLHRFFRYTDVSAPDQSWNSMSAGDRKRLVQSHNRIVVAVSSLINLAPDVGYYVYQMPKARNIVITSAKFYLSSNIAPAGGLPIKERGNSVTLVSGALEVLSPEFQANYLRPPSRGGGPPLSPQRGMMSRANSAKLSVFQEGGEDKDSAEKEPVPHALKDHLNQTHPPDRRNKHTVLDKSKSRKESVLPVVKVSQPKETKKSLDRPKRSDGPQLGTNSLVEYAHLFAEGSDWTSFDNDSKTNPKRGLITVEVSAADTCEERPEDFELRLRQDYEKERRKENKRMEKQRALSGHFGPSSEDRAFADEEQRPFTAPTQGTTVCEFFQFMPPTPALPKRLTSADRDTSTPAPASLKSKAPVSFDSAGDSLWGQLDDKTMSTGNSRRLAKHSGGISKSRSQSKAEKILEGAIMAYGSKSKGGDDGRRHRSGAQPSSISARIRRGSDEFPSRPGTGESGGYQEARNDPNSSETQTSDLSERGRRDKRHGFDPKKNEYHTTDPSTGEVKTHTCIKLDGIGRPEALVYAPQNTRPPQAAYAESPQSDQHASLFLSVADGGHDHRDYINKEQDDDLYLNGISVEPTDQPSMWVSEVDKNSVYQQDYSHVDHPRSDSSHEKNSEGIMSRMLIADIISSLNDCNGASA